jgi:hypothetical protein
MGTATGAIKSGTENVMVGTADVIIHRSFGTRPAAAPQDERCGGS